MNSQLKDKKFNIPTKILDHLNQTLKTMSHISGVGMKRLRRLVDEKVMTYQQLKRLLYDFKTIDSETDSYKLNGGDVMFKWVQETLTQARKEIEQQKKSAQRATELTPGKKNPYRKSHEKNGEAGSVDMSRLSEEIKRSLKMMNRYL